MKRKFRNNGNNLITATRPQYIKTKGTVEEESRIIKGNSFKKSINLYFRKSKVDKIRWEKKTVQNDSKKHSKEKSDKQQDSSSKLQA